MRYTRGIEERTNYEIIEIPIPSLNWTPHFGNKQMNFERTEHDNAALEGNDYILTRTDNDEGIIYIVTFKPTLQLMN